MRGLSRSLSSGLQVFLSSLSPDVEQFGPWQMERREELQVRAFEVARGVISEPVMFLEFGTGQGNGVASAIKVFTSSESRFVGFDTFQGLPEQWQGRIPDYYVDGVRVREPGEFMIPQGTFGTGSITPHETGRIVDTRVSFIAGLIQETLPKYLLQNKLEDCRLVVNVDVDLYTTTSTILKHLRSCFRPGDILIFDEFYDELGEFRAFTDYVETTGEWGLWHLIGHDGKVFVFQRGA